VTRPTLLGAVEAYEDCLNFRADEQMGIDQVPLFDAHIEIYTDDERIKIQYDT